MLYNVRGNLTYPNISKECSTFIFKHSYVPEQMTYQSLEIKALHSFKEFQHVELPTTKLSILGDQKPHNLVCI
jgi:hypothetical protein